MSFVKCCFESTEGHDFLDSFVQKCTDPGCVSIACGTQISVLLNLILAHAILVLIEYLPLTSAANLDIRIHVRFRSEFFYRLI
ncbi:unnamed protein product [Euphydryas editha]|uniref:Uncharacterized protein n=1 Tax=Euphydryas editha TaxID=104508 RepID=A0AAU9UFP2_EUPED|nr:unnamed protein product [Euphydryas editha]